MSKGKYTILHIIIWATIFGLASGVVGAIVARVYILESALNLPLFGEIDFSDARLGGSSLVISGAKKVVVEQNDKVTETLNAVKSSIVGIYEKKSTSSAALIGNTIDLDHLEGLYSLHEALGQALVITSDGWMVTSYTPPELNTVRSVNKHLATTTDLNKKIAEKYAILTKNGEVYNVDSIIIDPKTSYSFWHFDAEGLPVKKFISREDVANGDLVISVNWQEWTWISSIVDKDNFEHSKIKDSDAVEASFLLEEEPGKDFYGSFLFNLNGEVLAMIDQEGEIKPIYNYTSCIACLLLNKEIRRASLGVYYVDLSQYIGFNSNKISGGALIAKNTAGVAVKKGSPAAKAGLMEGDVIYSVNKIDLSKDLSLSVLINRYQVGDELEIEYERNGEMGTMSVVLGEL